MRSVIAAALLLTQGVVCLPRQVFQPRGHITGFELSQFHFKPYSLPSMIVSCTKDHAEDPEFNCMMQFTWSDPNANNSSSHCDSQWMWDGVASTPPMPQNDSGTDYFECSPQGNNTSQGSLFQFKFQTMEHPSSFSLLLSHTFEDMQDFPSPQRANLFGQANLTLNAEQQTDTSLTYEIPSPQSANITGITI